MSAVKANRVGYVSALVLFGVLFSSFPIVHAFGRTGLFAPAWARIAFSTPAIVGCCIGLIGAALGLQLCWRAEKMQGSHGVNEWPQAAGGALATCAVGLTSLFAAYCVLYVAGVVSDAPSWVNVLCFLAFLYFFVAAVWAALLSMWSFGDEGDDEVAFDMNAIKVQRSGAWNASHENDDAGGF